MRHASLCAALALVACDDTVAGLSPVGGDQPSEAELERFARHLHLDLTGNAPPDDFVADVRARLTAANTAAERGAFADELIDSPEFAELWVGELENRAFGGESTDARYAFLCAIVRDDDPACATCGPPSDGDFCGSCACAALTYYHEEREALRSTPEDLAGGDSTASVERRFAEAVVFQALSGPDALAASLFTVFLGHDGHDEELRNAVAMIQGALFPGAPAGILYHRHGSDYADLLDIVFQSEVYREAVVSAVFERYLGRRPSAPELGHFAATLGDDPDARDVIRAVVSSREYFEQ